VAAYCVLLEPGGADLSDTEQQSVTGPLQAAWQWALEQASPIVSQLPEWSHPILLILVALVIIFGAAKPFLEFIQFVWSVTRRLFGFAQRLNPNYQPPKDKIDEVKDGLSGLQSDVNEIKEALLKQIAESQGGSRLPEDVLERAIGAVQEVLASNDPIKNEAQTALRGGDVKGAETALANAFDAEVDAIARFDDQADQLRANAAQTARQKAALASTRSITEAIEWYEKALAYEPQDFWASIELGRLHWANNSMDAALAATRQAAGLASSDRERMIVHNDLGLYLNEIGKYEEAMEEFRPSLAIAEELAKQEPGDPENQRDLAVAYSRVGDSLLAMGDIEGAETYFAKDLEITQQLVEKDSSDTEWQRDLSVAHGKMGDLKLEAGQSSQALSHYQESLAIAQRLADLDASSIERQNDLVVCYARVANALIDLDQFDEALEPCTTAIEIRKRVAEADKESTGWQRQLSASYERLGDVHELRGDFAEAIRWYELSYPIAKSLAEHWPDNEGFQNDLDITERRLEELRAGRDGE